MRISRTTEFVKEQLAGDEMPDAGANPDRIIATGFYRLGIWDDEPSDKLQARYENLDDIVTTTGQVFLGLTVDCARCHNHKIDPIPQTDYYRLLAFFQNIREYRNGGPGDETPILSDPAKRETFERNSLATGAAAEGSCRADSAGRGRLSAASSGGKGADDRSGFGAGTCEADANRLPARSGARTVLEISGVPRRGDRLATAGRGRGIRSERDGERGECWRDVRVHAGERECARAGGAAGLSPGTGRKRRRGDSQAGRGAAQDQRPANGAGRTGSRQRAERDVCPRHGEPGLAVSFWKGDRSFARTTLAFRGTSPLILNCWTGWRPNLRRQGLEAKGDAQAGS